MSQYPNHAAVPIVVGQQVTNVISSHNVQTDVLTANTSATLQHVDVIENAAIGGNVAIHGNESVHGTFGVTGATTLDGATNINGTLNVANNSTVTGNSSIHGNEVITGALSVGGSSTFSNPIGVTGNITSSANIDATGTLYGRTALQYKSSYAFLVVYWDTISVSTPVAGVISSSHVSSDFTVGHNSSGDILTYTGSSNKNFMIEGNFVDASSASNGSSLVTANFTSANNAIFYMNGFRPYHPGCLATLTLWQTLPINNPWNFTAAIGNSSGRYLLFLKIREVNFNL
jgi:hypothetical protein